MKAILAKLILFAGALVLAFATVPGAQAECGLPTTLIKPASWQPAYGAANPSLVLADLDDDSPSIVGMWHVIFTAQTSI